MKNENSYGWKDEAIKQNTMVADRDYLLAERDYEIYALKARLRRYEPLLPLTPLERAEEFFVRHVLAFGAGMFFGILIILVRIAK